MHKEALCGRGQCVKTAQNLRKLGRFCAVFVSRAPEDGCPYEIYCQLSIENRSSEGMVIASRESGVAIRNPCRPIGGAVLCTARKRIPTTSLRTGLGMTRDGVPSPTFIYLEMMNWLCHELMTSHHELLQGNMN